MFDLGISPSQKLKQAPHRAFLCDHWCGIWETGMGAERKGDVRATPVGLWCVHWHLPLSMQFTRLINTDAPRFRHVKYSQVTIVCSPFFASHDERCRVCGFTHAALAASIVSATYAHHENNSRPLLTHLCVTIAAGGSAEVTLWAQKAAPPHPGAGT